MTKAIKEIKTFIDPYKLDKAMVLKLHLSHFKAKKCFVYFYPMKKNYNIFNQLRLIIYFVFFFNN